MSRTGAGKCFSISDCSTPLEVDTKSFSSSSRSTCSIGRASPGDADEDEDEDEDEEVTCAL